jgi:hypothetical protein
MAKQNFPGLSLVEGPTDAPSCHEAGAGSAPARDKAFIRHDSASFCEMGGASTVCGQTPYAATPLFFMMARPQHQRASSL